LQNKSNQNGLKTGKWIQTENFMNTESQQEDTKKRRKIGTWKEFMNDRLLSKEKYKKKQLPCD
jgi:hypothetical protein